MKPYLISYDLLAPGKDYTSLFDAIKRMYPTHWHCLKSQWIVAANGDAASICKSLLPYLDRNDKLLVSPITQDTAWWNLGDANADEWLRERLRKAA